MATEWHSVSEDRLHLFINKIQKRFAGQSVSCVESTGFVPATGAFVPIESRSDAKALFLSEVLVVLCRRRLESYEEVLAEDFTQGCFVSAESKTADIEKKLISGVHGPKECVFVEVQ